MVRVMPYVRLSAYELGREAFYLHRPCVPPPGVHRGEWVKGWRDARAYWETDDPTPVLLTAPSISPTLPA